MNIWTRRLARGRFIIIAAAGVLGVLRPLPAHDVITTKITWTQEISRIVQRRCIGCHASGSDIALSTYAEARPWAKAIRDQVLSRRMPPWGAVEGVGDFRNDPSLTNLEMETITYWVEGGAPEGDPGALPKMEAVAASEETTHCGRPLVLQKGSAEVRGRFLGMQSLKLTGGGFLEATAELPDGEIRRLIWIRDFPALRTAPYLFSEPMDLPPGTRVFVDATPGAKLELCR